MVVVRFVTGTAWSLGAMVAGAWVAVSPWALGEQAASARWSATTTTLLGTGVALMILGLWGSALVLGTLVADLSFAGLLPRGSRSEREQRTEQAPAPPQEEEILAHLAKAVAAELARRRPRGVPERPDEDLHQRRRWGVEQ
jgi:hypothetical protein